MLIRPDCLPCIISVRLRELKMLGIDRSSQLRIMQEIVRSVGRTPLKEAHAPFVDTNAFRVLKELTGVADPHREYKSMSNEIALGLFYRS